MKLLEIGLSGSNLIGISDVRNIRFKLDSDYPIRRKFDKKGRGRAEGLSSHFFFPNLPSPPKIRPCCSCATPASPATPTPAQALIWCPSSVGSHPSKQFHPWMRVTPSLSNLGVPHLEPSRELLLLGFGGILSTRITRCSFPV